MKWRELLGSRRAGPIQPALAGPADAQPAELVGTWKFLNDIRTDPRTGKNADIFGAHPRGRLIYTAEGRMMVIVVPENRKPLEKDEDRIERHKHMVAYTGRYTIANGNVIHHVDAAWNEAWIGTDIIRFYKLTGDTLIITTAPTKYGPDSLEQVSALTLQREKS